jgi:hypothetical protein
MEITSETTSDPKIKWRALFGQSWGAMVGYLPDLKKKGRPRTSAWVLALCIAAAIGLDERFVRLLPIGPLRTSLFDFTYVGKWELASLLATTFMTIYYWIDQMGNHEEIEARFLKIANFCLFVSVLFLAVAIRSISATPSGYSLLSWHLLAVCLIAVSFFFNDLFTWQGMEAKELILQKKQSSITTTLNEAERCLTETHSEVQNLKPLKDLVEELGDTIMRIKRHKHESRSSLLLVDIPMCLSFLCLFSFIWVHFFEHYAYHHWIAQLKWGLLAHFQSTPANRPPMIDIWASKEYFVGGAIAFQFLVSAISYVLISARALSTDPPAPTN